MSAILYADDRPIAVLHNDEHDMWLHGTNCRNCGAPLNTYGDCEYCGTAKQLKSEIVIDEHSIRFSCG